MNGRLHHYTADSKDRNRVHIWFFIISLVLAYLLNRIFLYCNFQPGWWLDTPSVFGFYGILYGVFNNYLWKWKVLHKIGLIDTPDLNGKYEGTIESSYDDFKSKKTVLYEIKQKWDNILVFSETDTSSSSSLTGAFSLVDVNKKSFVFKYQNTPKAGSVQTMQTHCGFADFYFNTTDAIIGEFFNGRGRGTHGKIELRKVT